MFGYSFVLELIFSRLMVNNSYVRGIVWGKFSYVFGLVILTFGGYSSYVFGFVILTFSG